MAVFQLLMSILLCFTVGKSAKISGFNWLVYNIQIWVHVFVQVPLPPWLLREEWFWLVNSVLELSDYSVRECISLLCAGVTMPLTKKSIHSTLMAWSLLKLYQIQPSFLLSWEQFRRMGLTQFMETFLHLIRSSNLSDDPYWCSGQTTLTTKRPSTN